MNIVKGRITSSQRVVIYGPEGIGKSSLASKWPKPLFLDVEGGTKSLSVDRVMATDWQQVLNFLAELQKDRGGYQTLVIDSADWLDKLCAQFICERAGNKSIEDFGYGKGYVFMAEEFSACLFTLTELLSVGMQIVITAHSNVVKVELPGNEGAFDHYEMKCSRKVTPIIKEWCDALLFINYSIIVEKRTDGKTIARGGKVRQIHTQHTAAYDAKNRWGLGPVFDVGGVTDPLPKELSEHLVSVPGKAAEPKPAAGKPATDKPATSKFDTELKKFCKDNGIEWTDLKSWLDKKGVKRLTQKTVDKLTGNAAQVKAEIEKAKENK